ncbi:MAG: tetratricopeptide repeat protein [Phycisphaerae bacterium]|nr:tetratricopeptide repeat protein [Phycisphaerae bacterium]
MNIADPMPEFSVVDSQGTEFSYSQTNPSALLVLFFSPEKQQSNRAVVDIQEIIQSLPELPHPLSLLVISDDPNSVSPIKMNKNKLTAHFVTDSDYKLWGMLGIIASPTIFITGTNGKIELIKAGHGYDFAPLIKSKLQVIMGLALEKDAQDVIEVKTVTNDSTEGKVNRHIKMAKMLESRGNYDGALEQLEMAIQIDPNAIECKLELGRVYCIVADPNKAISLVETIRSSGKDSQDAVRFFILGKSYFQLGDYAKAEGYLQETVVLDPKNSQAFYELGRIYQFQNQDKKAMEAYRKSLDLIYREGR